jgi:hypothetical protein
MIFLCRGPAAQLETSLAEVAIERIERDFSYRHNPHFASLSRYPDFAGTDIDVSQPEIQDLLAPQPA